VELRENSRTIQFGTNAPERRPQNDGRPAGYGLRGLFTVAVVIASLSCWWGVSDPFFLDRTSP